MKTEVQRLEKEIYELKQQLAKARREQPREAVQNYTFARPDGTVTLAELFGDRSDLLVIHNMGKGCSYCTLWADGFNGVAAHLENRAAFVLVSPDDPHTQTEFARSRGWTFALASDQETTFTRDMGYIKEEGWWPGVSAFQKDADGKIYRTGQAIFGPGDDFCSVWPLFDLLTDGANNWEPQYQYDVPPAR